ncbi:MAG: Ig-like domain-containing protein, partial [Clostridia bacterium]|nr:Ig-like domain-containing protein [Clostridia bacterium]
DCKRLNYVRLSDSLRTIDDLAFYNCTSLTRMFIPDSVTYIGDRALGIYSGSGGNDYAMEGFTISCCKGSCAYAYALYAIQAGIFEFIDFGHSQYYVDYYYYFNEDNTISIYHYLGDKSTVVIPSTIDGYTVARIESGTFFDNDTITNVTVTSTVHCIGHASFSGCDNLKDVSLTEGLEEIGDDYDPLEYDTYGAFEHCPSLKNIKIPASVKNMTYSGLGYYVDGSKIPGFTITGYKGTVGQSYATKNGFKFVALDYITPDYIELNKKSITLGVGESYNLKVTTTPSNAKTEYTWSSNKKDIATVSSTGNITAKSTGTATITVKTSNGKTASCTITVKSAPNKISLNKTSLTLGVGETFDLNSSLPDGTASYSIKYSSSNTAVAPVNASGGLVTAKKAGTAVITATTYNGKTATCTVTVKNPPSKISLNKASVILGVGETFDLNSSLPSDTASYSVKYSSNNTDIATVKEAGGLVTAKKVGTAVITATTYNGKTATCTVTVKNAPTKLSLNKTTATLGVGETFNLISSIPSDTACYNIKYSSSNTAVATVDEASGLVTAKSTGRAVITALTHNSKKATCTVTVRNAPNEISLNQTSLTLGIGEAFKLNSSTPSDTASYNVKYSSSNTAVATVNEADGLV